MKTQSSIDQAEYARVVRERLGEASLQLQPGRLLFGVANIVVAAACVFGVLSWHSLVARLVLAVALGHSLGVVSFLGHEVLHGSVVRGSRLVRQIGGLCFLYWGMLPSVWIRWHNQMHHQNTNAPFDDPDCWGTDLSYRQSAAARVLERFAPGSGTATSFIYLPTFFSVKVFFTLFFYPRFFRAPRHAVAARTYFVVVQIAWIALAWWAAGVAGLIFLFVVPLATANCLLMSYISTNHALNPLTETVNDCLANSLTIKLPAWLAWLHMNFNYHVEHHVLPSASPRFARRVRAILLENWPNEYHELPLGRALVALYRTPRFYKDSHTLVNPRTEATARTLV